MSTEERPSEDTEKMAIHKLRREDSEETNSADMLILDFKPSEVCKDKLLLSVLFCYGSLNRLTQKDFPIFVVIAKIVRNYFLSCSCTPLHYDFVGREVKTIFSFC